MTTSCRERESSWCAAMQAGGTGPGAADAVRPLAVRQSGLTIVELMVALLVSSILVIFMLNIKAQLVQSFRGQTIVSDVGSNVRMAAGAIRRDLAHAGYLLPGGRVEVASGVDAAGLLEGLMVRNNVGATGNDELYMLSVDDGRMAIIDRTGPVFADTAELEASAMFAPDDLLILGTPSAACLVMASVGTNPNHVHFNPTAATRPFNEAPQNRHCDGVRDALLDGEPTLITSFAGRGYRIDPDRPELGVLQLSPSAGLRDDDWVDLGIGFTNMQVATRYYEEGSTVDRDGSGDPERNWYSSDNQHTPPLGARPIAVSISLEARSTGQVSHVPSSATPAFTDLERPDHNAFGDWGQPCPGAELDPCGIDLASTSDDQRPARYRGDHIYRSTTITVNLRNMGDGSITGAPPGDSDDTGGGGNGKGKGTGGG